jgi:hypothetical protein
VTPVAESVIKKDFNIKSITTPAISYTANVENNGIFDISNYATNGYKIVGVLGFNTQIQNSTCRRLMVQSDYLLYSITSPNNLNMGLQVDLLEIHI